MRRIASLVLTIALVIAAIPTAFAYVPGGNLCIAQHDGSEEYSGIECCAICDWCPVCEGDCDCLAPVDYSVGTQVVFQANGTESYTITVPALLAPGQSGTVTLQGTWAENRVVTVAADPTVTLKNSLLETDTKTLNIDFNGGLSAAGSNIDSLRFTQQITVGNIENALFGTWSGKFNYNVEITDIESSEVISTYRYMDRVDEGDFAYFYLDCQSYEEAGIGALKSMLYQEGIDCYSDEEVLNAVAGLMAGCTWADLQAQGYTVTSLLEQLGFTEEVYEEGKSTFVVGWQASAIDKTKESYGPIQSYVDEIPVVSMANTFSDCEKLIQAPSIPNTVTNMSHAFSYCTNLESAPVIPSSVKNLEYTFASCEKLKAMPEISYGVENMEQTFAFCSSLTETTDIPASVVNMQETFKSCDALVTAPVIPASVTSLNGTFDSCISLVNIPELHDGITSMQNTFYGCDSLTVAPRLPSGLIDMSSTFYGCDALANAPVIPDGVKYMSRALAATAITTTPILPESVVSLSSAFSSCHNLTTVQNIPSHVEDMDHAFSYCEKLTYVPRIPETVTTMIRIFDHCDSLTMSVEIPCSIPSEKSYWTNSPVGRATYHVTDCDGSCGK